jgi:hypothetical protein
MNDPSLACLRSRGCGRKKEKDPGEVFTVTTDLLAVDGPTAVVRAEVIYGDPPGTRSTAQGGHNASRQ